METVVRKKVLKKITVTRLKNIALYYLKRFETTRFGLKSVLRRRIDAYAYQDKEFDKTLAYEWVENLLDDFEAKHYVDDERFASFKVRDYLAAGKSPRYVLGKMKEKGVDEQITLRLLNLQDYNPYDAAMKLAKKKKIGPFEPDEAKRRERRSKDLAILVRAGFDYDVAVKVLESKED
ncbi:MAG: RecX family transcriptional regulator [Alphaproteobacteria bacterium]|nr:RecX family transcriptional regulator [Alphaproteobacteria bacterium]